MSKTKHSKVNYSFVPLETNDVFNGLAENTDDYAGVFVNLYSDKDCQLTLKWGNDTANFHWEVVENILADTSFYKSYVNLGKFFKLSVENTDIADMTSLSCTSRFISDAPDSSVAQPFVMTQLWDNDSVANGNTSVGVDITTVKQVDIFGTVNGSCDLIIQVTDDSTVWYDSSNTIVCANAGDFHTTVNLSAKFVRLWMSSGGTRLITAHLNGK